ncbi:hypothetical protein L228DRAFT_258142 [Xylona heveae TC161]|uniref:Uncharacterized protein n=1 Tax=Xylona heveae (strain CBS 132557 / TC161) TaxID=1328760 RepID=A0A165JXR0_XYLHT|nr:hypothetical protein L228DRAFT_258142 [Xylona heveae TC161]KZF26759.1 hypothetical protein L228DRAFT_258142 [Xylona heveae TC161]
MDLFIERITIIFPGIAFVVIFGYLTTLLRSTLRQSRGKSREWYPSFFLHPLSNASSAKSTHQAERPSHASSPVSQSSQCETTDLYKELYYKLQNLETFPDILPKAKDTLVSMFAEALASANPDDGILSVKEYSRDALASFLQEKENSITERWQQYIARRNAGAPRELFEDAVQASWWLKQSSPVRYVDGAWLGHINKISTPFNLRSITKHAWQVLSEELGDGDQAKNHVHLYRELMREIEAGLPDGDSEDYIHPKTGLDQPRVWKAAVSQLLISLFPHEFLPEILGFNLSFEGITMETLMASKELEELKINPYYFVLHVTIDNADSGHTAMALHATAEYVEHIRHTQGETAAQQVWKRVQTGFVLSESLPTTPVLRPAQAQESKLDNPWAYRVAKIFKAKAVVAHKIHCNTSFKIGRRTLVDWLEPAAFESPQWQKEFLDALSNRKPWVYKGDSNRSRLVQELGWGGKMFGSFTREEIEVVKQWIDSLAAPNPHNYWSFIGCAPNALTESQKLDIFMDYPVFSPSTSPAGQLLPLSHLILDQSLQAELLMTSEIDMQKFLPLWFAHPCLLESFISVPFEASGSAMSSITRLLRAQFGFGIEGPWVDGMDEIRRSGSIGLVEIGLEIVKRADEIPIPGSLKDVMENGDAEFATTMLDLSMRPKANAAVLLGLTSSFIDLHAAIAVSSLDLLSPESKELLGQISCRERAALESCCESLLNSKKIAAEGFNEGYMLGRMKIRECFEIPEV